MPVNKQIILNQEEDKQKPMEEEIPKADNVEPAAVKNTPATVNDETPDKLLGDDLEIEKAKNKKRENGDRNTY